MITIKYPDGKVETRTYVIASGDPPVGMARPIPDGATVEFMAGCVKVSKDDSDAGFIWPWEKVTEITLGPKMAETAVLRE